MLIKLEQLNTVLNRSLAPVYLLTGDEPLQIGEAADAIRSFARTNGFEERELICVDNAGFKWSQLLESKTSCSLFAEKKIIDLRLSITGVGSEGAQALTEYCKHTAEDNILIVSAGKLSKEAQKSKWFKAIDSVGIIIQVWPPEGKELQRWLQLRLAKRGLNVAATGLDILAARIEGNLLAAAQEIEKLYGLYGEGTITNQQLLDAVGDNSKFDVYKLIDSVLSAQIPRIFRILASLQAEGIAAAIVLWALTREARTLVKLKSALASGQAGDAAYKQLHIWDNRKALVSNALARLSDKDLNTILLQSALADRQIKGQESGNAWETLLAVCLLFASVPTINSVMP